MRSWNWWSALFVVAGIATPLVIYWLRRRALRERVTAPRAATEAERAALRRRGRTSVAFFVSFWIAALSIVALVAVLRPRPIVERLALAAVGLMVVAGIAYQLNTRCPICGYRLGYQIGLGVPRHCERCRARL